MSGTSPLLVERDRPQPVQSALTGLPWRQGLRQIALALGGSGKASREDVMTVLGVANSVEPHLRALEERM